MVTDRTSLTDLINLSQIPPNWAPDGGLSTLLQRLSVVFGFRFHNYQLYQSHSLFKLRFTVREKLIFKVVSDIGGNDRLLANDLKKKKNLAHHKRKKLVLGMLTY